jgi:hypothetical protein
MLRALENGIRGLQSNDLQMDILGSRLSSDISIPFPQAFDQAGASPASPVLISPEDGGRNFQVPAAGERTSFSQLPGLLPDSVTNTLKGDLAFDMGNFLVAKAAYQVNARVISAASYELRVLTRLGQ